MRALSEIIVLAEQKTGNGSAYGLSKATGLSEQSLCAWKKGLYAPNGSACRTIALAAGVSLEEVLDAAEVVRRAKKV